MNCLVPFAKAAQVEGELGVGGRQDELRATGGEEERAVLGRARDDRVDGHRAAGGNRGPVDLQVGHLVGLAGDLEVIVAVEQAVP